MDKQTENKPATVSVTTQQAGEIYRRWWFVERSVWTERMLTALENGVKGSKWFRLIDKANRLWPNAYFTEQGLYTLAPALVTRRQSR